MTGSMETRKSGMPEANKMARMLRSGRTVGDLALRYGINSNVIMQQLTANGWDAGNGAWVGGDKNDYKTGGAPLSSRGDGAGQTCHHVGGGDNPNVVPTTSRPFTERPKPRGFNWPTPVAVPPERKRRTPIQAAPPVWTRERIPGTNRKISVEQEPELVKRYLDGESSISLAPAFGVNERTIRKHLHALGVPLRSRSEALQLRHQQRRDANTATLAAIDSLRKEVA